MSFLSRAEPATARVAARGDKPEVGLEAQRDFAAVLESRDEGVVACDAHGDLTFFNGAARRLHGLPARPLPAADCAVYYDLYRVDGITPMPARAVEYRDASTTAHVERMSHGCRLLAERAGLTPERCETIEIASRLHDIGKVAVPDAVLLKPGRLDADEWRLMESHTLAGHELLAGSGNGVFDLAATIALSHHERIDGTGYPHGLEGISIPLEARIAAIADAFDALTSERPYRQAFTADEAIALLARGRGSHFAAELFDLFVEIVGQLPEPVAAPVESPVASTHVEPVPVRLAPTRDPAVDVRECLVEASADLSDHLLGVRDDEADARERLLPKYGLGGVSNAGTDSRQPARDRRWAADDRIRAAATRAAALRLY